MDSRTTILYPRSLNPPFSILDLSLSSQSGHSGHRFREFVALHRIVGAEDSAVGGHQPAIERDLDVAAQA